MLLDISDTGASPGILSGKMRNPVSYSVSPWQATTSLPKEKLKLYCSHGQAYQQILYICLSVSFRIYLNPPISLQEILGEIT